MKEQQRDNNFGIIVIYFMLKNANQTIKLLLFSLLIILKIILNIFCFKFSYL